MWWIKFLKLIITGLAVPQKGQMPASKHYYEKSQEHSRPVQSTGSLYCKHYSSPQSTRLCSERGRATLLFLFQENLFWEFLENHITHYRKPLSMCNKLVPTHCLDGHTPVMHVAQKYNASWTQRQPGHSLFCLGHMTWKHSSLSNLSWT